MRRRLVVAGTLVVGAGLLALAFATDPGSAAFEPLLAAVALAWTAGAFLAGPLPAVRFGATLRHPVRTPVTVGLAAAAVFLAGGAITRGVPVLHDYVVHVLDHAEKGTPWLVGLLALLNGAAEELFFRGAVFATFPERRAVAGSAAVYVLATAATGSPLLVLAGATMGLLFGLERRLSGGLLAPVLTHLSWTLVLLLALPAVTGA